MDKELCIADVSIEDCRYLYYLVEKNKEFEEKGKIDIYGVKIQKLKENNVIDESIVNDIFIDKHQTINFINYLKDNTVTPISLEYIVEDYI